SHNCTASAWGFLTRPKNPTTQQREWSISMRNWEVGVVLPVFEGVGGDVVVPFRVPVKEYERGDVPWVSDQ
ncbi:hypothetical protein HK097_005161, partial [Rhizophlyctis rosea]